MAAIHLVSAERKGNNPGRLSSEYEGGGWVKSLRGELDKRKRGHNLRQEDEFLGGGRTFLPKRTEVKKSGETQQKTDRFGVRTLGVGRSMEGLCLRHFWNIERGKKLMNPGS